MFINPDENKLPLSVRLLIAIPLALVFIAGGTVLFLGGLIIATFSTDACRILPDWPTYFLFGVWPLVMLISALVPPILISISARWWWAAASVPAGLFASIATFFLWFPIIMRVC